MALRSLLGWLGRKAAVYLILAAAMLFALLVWPQVKASLSNGPGAAARSLAQTKDDVEAALVQARVTLAQREKNIRGLGRERLAGELAATEAELVRAQARGNQQRGVFDTVRPGKILERKMLEIELAYLESEIAALKSALAAADAKDRVAGARQRLGPYLQVPSERAIAVAQQRCAAAKEAVSAFQEKWLLERALRNLWKQEKEKLVAAANSACSSAQNLKQRRADGLRLAREYREATSAFERARDWQAGQIASVSDDLEKGTIGDLLKKALVALVFIIITPYLIRLLFYFVFAPAAERRGTIRLDLARGGAEPSAPAASSTSVPLRLGAGEELLVRQGYLQSTSRAGPKATQWFLDWRRPLSSLASGLVFLTRVRGEGETTTVSAVRDPFAEVTTLDLPAGASFVLHPRAIAAVTQLRAQPLRITSHWRLASLSAWLTLQLRFLAFHGPARVVIKGGRGVRVERAEQGRVFGQDQLVGFSTDLAYSVSRTETFWPYFLGREPLFRDHVEVGGGLLVIEEAPLVGPSRRDKRGLEGAFDASLKAFGM